MAQKDRLDQIRQLVRTEKKVSVNDLSEQFGVTPETIRRDLEKLEGEGLAVRTYGGAVFSQTEPIEKIDYDQRSMTNVDEKRAIAQLVVPMIPHGTRLGCDASSTVMETLNSLREREDLLVLTNSARVIRELDKTRFGVLSTGGRVNRQSYSMQGGVAKTMLQEYHLDLVLVSCRGLSREGGVFDSHELETDVKRALIERGNRVILLADHTKFGRVAFVKLTDLDQVHMLVTDRKPDEEWLQLFALHGVEVVYPQ
ncbi:MAG: DeoR/GlpR family DNA-binding transcription regulator [Lachnospiraceae bacterium]|jgi:DeoR/GlpR family transcriptional regulator of sugar metabolism|nr:DeoR/GlpR family DNA-binding transcription regulator [Lachnospiraceae bacterium]